MQTNQMSINRLQVTQHDLPHKWTKSQRYLNDLRLLRIFVTMDKTEIQIQQECVMWFNNNHLHIRKRLFAINNNSHNRIKGAINKAIGVNAGVSDLALILTNGQIAWLECKTEKGVQSKAQKEFQSMVTELDHPYLVFRSLREFKTIIGQLLEEEKISEI